MRPSLSSADAAQRIGTTTQHAQKLAREGRIPHYRVGALYRFDPDELDDWLAASHVVPEPSGSPAEVRERVRASRAAQGLATPTDDPVILDRLAVLMAADGEIGADHEA